MASTRSAPVGTADDAIVRSKERPYARAMREKWLTAHDRQNPPYRAPCRAIVVISAVTEVGIVRAIGYGFGPFTLTYFKPYVEEIQKIVGTPGIATTGKPVEWTGYVYRVPYYVTRSLDWDATPRGIYLFRRCEPISTEGWSFCFEEEGEFLAPLPTGW